MGFLRRRIRDPLLGLLKQGLTPEKLALCVAVGLACSLFPMLGVTTLLCALAAWFLRLNQPAVQLVNYLAYPLQLLLLIPFVRLGERIFSAPRMPLSLPVILAQVKADPWGSFRFFWTSTWHALVAWFLVVPAAAAVLGWVLVPLFRRLVRRNS